MKSNSLKQNSLAIKRGLQRFRISKDEIIMKGMYALLDAALDYLQDAHAVLHEGAAWRHPNESNTLGWALVHNGAIIEAVSQSKGPITPHGDALASLERIASHVGEGWVGIVCSDMQNGWYRVDWEEDFLNYTVEMTAQTFMDYFTPIN